MCQIGGKCCDDERLKPGKSLKNVGFVMEEFAKRALKSGGRLSAVMLAWGNCNPPFNFCILLF